MKTKKQFTTYFIALGVIIAVLIVLGITYPDGFSATIWSLLPPVVAIVLALISKEVYSSLFLGCLVGAMMRKPLLTPDGATRLACKGSSPSRFLIYIKTVA